MPYNTVKVDRSTQWGNPYVVGAAIDFKQVKRWGWNFHPQSKGFITPDAATAVRKFNHCLFFDQAIHDFVREQLGGKDLACWCPLDQPCHADVLLEFANR